MIVSAHLLTRLIDVYEFKRVLHKLRSFDRCHAPRVQCLVLCMIRAIRCSRRTTCWAESFASKGVAEKMTSTSPLAVMSLNSTAIVSNRKVARLIVLDASDRVLLVRYQDHRGSGSFFWATPGGEIENGERAQDAAVRELSEETGLTAKLQQKLWDKDVTFELPQGVVNQHEQYFLIKLPEVAPAVQNSSSEAICEHRWWSLRELQLTTETIYPDGLAADLQIVLCGAHDEGYATA